MATIDIEYGRELIESFDPGYSQETLQEMEMVLQNSSYGHEYAVLELQEAQGFLRREEINSRLEAYKNSYFQARQYLQTHYPKRLESLERQLNEQKVRIFRTYHA